MGVGIKFLMASISPTDVDVDGYTEDGKIRAVIHFLEDEEHQNPISITRRFMTERFSGHVSIDNNIKSYYDCRFSFDQGVAEKHTNRHNIRTNIGITTVSDASLTWI